MSLIDKEAVMSDMGAAQGCWISCADCEKINCLIGEVIDRQPAVYAEPVRHGEWTPINLYCNHAREFKCSSCGESVYYDYYTRFCEYDFCPNCGAKMSGGEENEIHG